MKRKWALGLCEGLITQAVRSLAEVIIFLAFSWLLSNHHGEQLAGEKTERKGIKKKQFLLFTPPFRKNCLSYLRIIDTDSTTSANYLFCWIAVLAMIHPATYSEMTPYCSSRMTTL